MRYSHIFLMALLVMLFLVLEGKAADITCNTAKKDEHYTELNWDKLMPPGWNPAKAFDSLNLDELDDNDPRVAKAMKKLEKMWDEAPTNPALRGKVIKISGFVASLDFTGKTELKEFLLVPYFGACIHVPPPPANQIIHVILAKPRQGIRSMDTVTVYGKLAIEKTETEMGRSGYSMKADAVEPYVEKKME